MGKEILSFGDTEIEKNIFYCHGSSIFLKDVDIEKILASGKIFSGEKNHKYFIGYLHNDNKVKPLHKMLPKTSTYVKSYDGQTKWMYFLIKDDDLLEKFNSIWDKVSGDIKKEFGSEPVYNKNFLKTKIKSYSFEVTDSFNKEIPKVNSNYTCLAVISLDSALKKDENHYPQVFLKECKDIKKKLIWHINDNLSDFSSSDYSDHSDEEEIKAVKLILSKKAILKMSSLRE